MIPNYQECMLPFLQLLSDNQIHTSKECVEKLSVILELTEEENPNYYPVVNKRLFLIEYLGRDFI